METYKMDKCVVYYESWQLQCCGDPFAVGEKVWWKVRIPEEESICNGTKVDFYEEHHIRHTHTVKGTIIKIIAERSELLKGDMVEECVSYEKSDKIYEELQAADGWESEMRSDETTLRAFWGYVVELKDVTVKQLKNKKHSAV